MKGIQMSEVKTSKAKNTGDIVFYSAEEKKNFLKELKTNIGEKLGDKAEILLNYPAIYIHVWRDKEDIKDDTWSVYVGETNDIIERTKQHWDLATAGKNDKRVADDGKAIWQCSMADAANKNDNNSPIVYYFGHKSFQKSLTLDLENCLINYFFSIEKARPRNRRGNPQGKYFGKEEYLEKVFKGIWKKMNQVNDKLCIEEAQIKKSAFYKASPYHELSDPQLETKKKIVERTKEAILEATKETESNDGKLIFVEGEAGSGKTVLASSTFYDIIENEDLKELKGEKLSCFMIVNNDELRDLYKNIAKRLCHSEEIILKATEFLNDHKIIRDDKDRVDVVFIDEAHLLWNQYNRSYKKEFESEHQLDEIIKRSRVTVIMYDEKQTTDKGHIASKGYFDKIREIADKNGNYIKLDKQFRMLCSDKTKEWIDSFSNELILGELSLSKDFKDDKDYEVQLYETPDALYKAIIGKAESGYPLSRLIATYDWPFINGKENTPEGGWKVEIGDFSHLWNEQTRILYEKKQSFIDIYSKDEMDRYNDLTWAEKPYSLKEVGSLYCIQGFDLSYAGVILGPSVKYDKERKRIIIDGEERKKQWREKEVIIDKKIKKVRDKRIGSRTISDEISSSGKAMFKDMTEDIIRHEIRILMTRGTNGLYIYACDDDLREAIKNSINNKN